MKLINSILTLSTLNFLTANPLGKGDCVIPPKSKEYDAFNGNPSLNSNTNPLSYDPNEFAGGSALGYENRAEPYRNGAGFNPGGGLKAAIALFGPGGSGSNMYTFKKREIIMQSYVAQICGSSSGQWFGNLTNTTAPAGSGSNYYGGGSGSNYYGGGSGSNFFGGGSGSSFLGGAMGSLFYGGGSGSNFQFGGSGSNFQFGGSANNLMAAGAHADDKADGSGRNPFGTKGFTPGGAQIACAKPENNVPVASARTIAQNKARKLRYYGGAVMTNIKVHPIYWGEKYDLINDNFDNYYRTILDSAWFNLLKQYSVSNSECGQIKPGTFIGSYHQSTNKTRVGYKERPVIDDAEIQNQIMLLLETNALPYPDAQTYYPVHLAKGINLTIDAVNATGCNLICAYHSHFYDPVWNQNIFYGVMIDSATCLPGQCGKKAASVSVEAATRKENNQMTASHELMESITDPIVGYGWFDYSAFQELGDACNQESIAINGHNGQVVHATKIFSNANINLGCNPRCPSYKIVYLAQDQDYSFCFPPYNPSFENNKYADTWNSKIAIDGWNGTGMNWGIQKYWTHSGTYAAYIGYASVQTGADATNLSNLTSDFINVIPGLNYNLTFFTRAWNAAPAVSNVTIYTITNATWFDTVTGLYGWKLVYDKIGVDTAEPNVDKARTMKKSVTFTAFDYSMALVFSVVSNRGVQIDSIELQPVAPPLCDANEAQIYSVGVTPTIFYHFCENPSNPVNPSLETICSSSVGNVPCGWNATRSDSGATLGKFTGEYVQSGVRAWLLGGESCLFNIENGKWARLSSQNALSVKPNLRYTITFHAARGCSSTSSDNRLFFKITEDDVNKIVLSDSTRTAGSLATYRQVSQMREFTAPLSGKIRLHFESRDNFGHVIDTIQVTQNSKTPLIVHQGAIYSGNGTEAPVDGLYTPPTVNEDGTIAT